MIKKTTLCSLLATPFLAFSPINSINAGIINFKIILPNQYINDEYIPEGYLTRIKVETAAAGKIPRITDVFDPNDINYCSGRICDLSISGFSAYENILVRAYAIGLDITGTVELESDPSNWSSVVSLPNLPDDSEKIDNLIWDKPFKINDTINSSYEIITLETSQIQDGAQSFIHETEYFYNTLLHENDDIQIINTKRLEYCIPNPSSNPNSSSSITYVINYSTGDLVFTNTIHHEPTSISNNCFYIDVPVKYGMNNIIAYSSNSEGESNYQKYDYKVIIPAEGIRNLESKTKTLVNVFNENPKDINIYGNEITRLYLDTPIQVSNTDYIYFKYMSFGEENENFVIQVKDEKGNYYGVTLPIEEKEGEFKLNFSGLVGGNGFPNKNNLITGTKIDQIQYTLPRNSKVVPLEILINRLEE